MPTSPPPLLRPCPTRSSAGCDELPRTPRSTLSPQRGNVGGVAHRRVSRAEAAAASPLGRCGTWPVTAETVAVGGSVMSGGRGRSSSSPRTPRGRRLPAHRRLGAATVPQGLPPLVSGVDGGGLCCTQVEGMCKEGEEGGTAHQPPFLAANRCFTAPQCCAGLPVSLPVAVAAGRVVAPNLAVWCARSPRRGERDVLFVGRSGRARHTAVARRFRADSPIDQMGLTKGDERVWGTSGARKETRCRPVSSYEL